MTGRMDKRMTGGMTTGRIQGKLHLTFCISIRTYQIAKASSVNELKCKIVVSDKCTHRLREFIYKTSGCPWPKATVKSPVSARDLRPV